MKILAVPKFQSALNDFDQLYLSSIPVRSKIIARPSAG